MVRVGRRPGSDLHLADADVSEHQAEIRWDGARWTCTDVGSKNGTLVGGRVLKRGESAQLAEGTAVVFAERQVWSLVDAGPPSWPFAIPLAGGSPVAGSDGELTLPPSAARVEVRITADGAWFAGQSGLGPAPLENGEVIVADGRSYRLLLEGYRADWP
jgi:pSer/pThr/pTyr-binding forkhead associated (FHA) protein